MRISDWSSDVCSSDLLPAQTMGQLSYPMYPVARRAADGSIARSVDRQAEGPHLRTKNAARCRQWIGFRWSADRKSVVSGKSVSVRVDIGGRRIIKKTKNVHTSDTNENKTATRK